MKNRTLLIGILLIIFMLIITGFIMYAEHYYSGGEQQTPFTASTTVSTASWKTFYIPKPSLTIKAPKDFTLVSTSTINRLNIPVTVTYFHTDLIQEAYIEAQETPGDCVSGLKNNPAYASTTVKINGVTFSRITWSDGAAGNLYRGIDYLAQRPTACDRIGLVTHSINGEGFFTDDERLIRAVDSQHSADIMALFSLFDKVASTVVLLK